MQHYKVQGIVLQTLKFKDFDQIITLYTREEGVIKLLIKGAYRKKQFSLDVFTEIECIYNKRQSSLYSCHDKSILNRHLGLRNTFQCLESACGIAKAVLDSQPEHKPSFLLYDLLIYSLNKLPLVSHPEAFEMSFLLKILRLEGLFGLTPQCSVCQTDLIEHSIARGESYCIKHKPLEYISLSPYEAASLYTLAFSRSSEQIDGTQMDNNLKVKIEHFFASQLNQ